MPNNSYKEFLLPGAIIFASLVIGGSLLFTATEKKTELGKDAGANVAQGIDSSPSPGNSALDIVLSEQDHMRGNPEAAVTLVEFSDFQCPFCTRFHSTVLKALEEYPGQLRWVYKHFPLDTIHPQARPAGEASECVWEQKGDEGFWQFVDALFENQTRLGPALYQEVAKEIGVNLSQFEQCVSERKYQEKVQAQYQEGLRMGVEGTPASFVNGVPVKGAIPFDEKSVDYQAGYPTLKSLIDSQL